MGEGFAGVDLNSVLSEQAPPQEQISDPKGEEQVSTEEKVDTQEAQKSQTTDLPDLDKLERFRFKGREMTRKELEDSFLMRGDYTKKTQEVAEARKYADNFHADLRAIVKDPRLLAEMRKVYPPDYVQITEEILKQLKPAFSQQQQPQATDQSAQSNLPPEVLERLEKVDRWERDMQERSTQAMLEQINTLHERMGKKYPYADPDVVDNRVSLAIEKGLKVDSANLSTIYENAYKQHDAALKSRFDEMNKKKVEEQVKAGRKARDVGAGGATPGSAPKKYTKIADVGRDLLKQYER